MGRNEDNKRMEREQDAREAAASKKRIAEQGEYVRKEGEKAFDKYVKGSSPKNQSSGNSSCMLSLTLLFIVSAGLVTLISVL